MYTLNEINEIRDYYKRIGLSKENSCYSMKRFKRKDLLLFTKKFL